jgi:hypothetical protein
MGFVILHPVIHCTASVPFTVCSFIVLAGQEEAGDKITTGCCQCLWDNFAQPNDGTFAVGSSEPLGMAPRPLDGIEFTVEAWNEYAHMSPPSNHFFHDWDAITSKVNFFSSSRI